MFDRTLNEGPQDALKVSRRHGWLVSNGLFTMAKGGCVFPKDHTTARVADFYINYGAFTTKYLAGVFAEFVSV